MNHLERFFWWMNERQRIYDKRGAGQEWPWTDDKILRRYSFTNVYRELDKTTAWFRDNVRDKLMHEPEVILATVIFRWFNRIETGKRLLKIRTHRNIRSHSLGAYVAWHPVQVEKRLRPFEPWITGAYMIKSPTGKDKLDGVIETVTNVWKARKQVEQELLGEQVTIEHATKYLSQFPFLGPFMAYEITTDLRHTIVLQNAPDIMTWANPGPGAQRGLNRIMGRPVKTTVPMDLKIEEMRGLLEMSPKYLEDHMDPLEMRDIEHSLCEFDKYERVRNDEGRPRGTFTPPEHR
jgi:hypothetical protein